MTRQEWDEIGRALASIRAEIAASWPPKVRATNPTVIHDRKLIYFAKLDGFDRAVKAVCRVLHKRSRRFVPSEFLRLVGL